MKWYQSLLARWCGRKKSQPNTRSKEWLGVAGVEAGTKHLDARPPIPCQDAALVRVAGKYRPCAFVADGAGSASVSHLGAQETVLRLSHLAAAMESIHAEMLDAPESPDEKEFHLHAHRLLIHASETLRDLANCKDFPFKEFHCTLLMVVIGAERIFWVKVGDGQIVQECVDGALQTIGPAGKGAHANETHFIRECADATIFSCGAFPATGTSGISLMTDGAAERLVSSDGKKVAGRINTFLDGIRNDKFGEHDLQKFLSDENVWEASSGYTGDDKGLALLSRQL